MAEQLSEEAAPVQLELVRGKRLAGLGRHARFHRWGGNFVSPGSERAKEMRGMATRSAAQSSVDDWRLHHQVSHAAHEGFLAGFNDVLMLGALLSFVGAVLALGLVREREIEREPMEPAGEPEAVPQPAVA
jgi:hypothetical protein